MVGMNHEGMVGPEGLEPSTNRLRVDLLSFIFNGLFISFLNSVTNSVLSHYSKTFRFSDHSITLGSFLNFSGIRRSGLPIASGARTGAATLNQCFGSALKLHLHMLFFDQSAASGGSATDSKSHGYRAACQTRMCLRWKGGGTRSP